MRLTLRTMLAYRDRVLRPADAEELHRRIHESQVAGNLLRRIDSLGKRNLQASPTIVGKGLAGDPNSYAEYLDDALAADLVPEFEKICLESDLNLSELADCHTLLSSAVHSRVQVPANLHALARGIGDPEKRDELKEELRSRRRQRDGSPIIRADAAHPIVDAPRGEIVGVQAPMVASGGGSIKEQGLDLEDSKLAHEVPEYLVGVSKGSWRVPLAIGLLVTVLGILIWQSLGPWERVVALFAAAPKELPSDSNELGNSDSAPANSPASEADLPNDPGIADTNSAGSPESNTAESAAESADLASENPEAVLANGNAGNLPNQPATGSASDPGTGKSTDAARENSASENTAPANPDAATPDVASPDATLPDATSTDANNSGLAVWLPQDDAGSKAVLLAKTNGTMRRIAPGVPLASGDELLVPPFYRTTIGMPGGTLWETCGPSKLLLGDASGQDGSTSLCRAMLRAGPSGDAMQLETPVGMTALKLVGAEAIAAIEVAYRSKSYGPVTDANAWTPVLIVVAADGKVELAFDGQQYEIASGRGIAILKGAKPKDFTLLNIPSWYRKGIQRPIDKIAANDLNLQLRNTVDATIEAKLQRLTNSKQPYLASLAIQLSALSGDWQPFLASLENEELRGYWSQAIQLARQLFASDAGSAATTKQLFTKKWPNDGQLFDLLVGLPSDQFASNEALSNLVQQLSSDSLPARVLASNQLRRLTGKHLSYLPHQPTRASTQQWRLELSKDRVELLKIQDVIWERIAR